MITIALYKLDTATVKTIKEQIKNFFYENDRNNIIEHKILVVKDEDELVRMFKFSWISMLILPSTEAIPSYFEETNLCMQMIDVIEDAEPAALTSDQPDKDSLRKPISSQNFNSVFDCKLRNFMMLRLSFTFELDGKTHTIDKCSVLYLQGTEKETIFHKIDGSIEAYPKHLKEIIPYFPRPDFSLINDSCMINMLEIEKIDACIAFFGNGQTLTIAPNYRNNILRDFMCQFQED